MKRLMLLFIGLLLLSGKSSGQTTVFFEGFDNIWTTPPTLSPQWSGTNTTELEWHKNDYTTGWLYGDAGSYLPTGASSTTGSARFNTYGIEDGVSSEFISPTINLSAYNSGINYLEFYYINLTGTDMLNVYLSTDGGSSWSNELITCNIASTWTLYSGISLSTTSSSVKLKFTGTSDYGYDDIGLDQVRVYNFDPNGPLLTVIPDTLNFGYSPAGIPTTSQTYTLSGSNLTAGPIVVSAPAGFDVSSDGSSWSGTVNVTYTPPTLPNTTIYARFNPSGAPASYDVIITNLGGGASRNLTALGTSIYSFCPAGSQSCDEYISNVTLGTIDNSSDCSTGGYEDYMAISTSLMRLVSYTITVTNGTPYSEDQCGIWVDWNKDGDFYDDGETITVTGTPGSGPYTATITPPEETVEGIVGLRIRIHWSDEETYPCGIAYYGEVEDYAINVINAGFGTLQGYVYDVQSGCAVGLNGATLTEGIYATTTDGSGFYQFLNTIPAGNHSFTANLAGYDPQIITGITVMTGNTTIQDFCLDPHKAAPSCLDGTLTMNDVHLSWFPPHNPPEQWMMWDDGTNYSSVGLSSGGTFSVACRWPESDIAPYDGMYLNKIEIYANDVNAIYTLKVWQGIDAGLLLLSQPVTPVLGWNEFILSSSVIIDGTQEFWFGYEVSHAAGTTPVGIDNGPNIEGKGNMIYDGAGWITLYELQPDLVFNWNLHGWVAPCGPYGPPPPLTPLEQGQPLKSPLAPLLTLTGYNVYRNNVLLASNIPDLFIDDLDLLTGSYDYQVSAQYDFGESDLTGPVSFTIECGSFTIPYMQNFDEVNAPATPFCMTVTNDNSDVIKWETSEFFPRSSPNNMRIVNNSSLSMDDWFFTPALTLDVGQYRLSSWYRSSGSFPEKLEIKWGSVPNAAGMTNGPIFTDNNIITPVYIEGVGTITVTEAGDYYVGWHGYSDMDMWYLIVDDISIEAVYIWTGMISSGWNEPGNWDRGAVPDTTCLITIPVVVFPAVYPTIVTGQTVKCCDLYILNGANVTVEPGATLNVMNNP